MPPMWFLTSSTLRGQLPFTVSLNGAGAGQLWAQARDQLHCKNKFNKELCYVTCTSVPLSILHYHLLHNHNLSLSCGHRTAVMIKICSRIYMALQLTWGRSLLQEQCHFWCVDHWSGWLRLDLDQGLRLAFRHRTKLMQLLRKLFTTS